MANGIDARTDAAHTPRPRGVVAQLVEHHNGIVGVRSSILLGSTILFLRILYAQNKSAMALVC